MVSKKDSAVEEKKDGSGVCEGGDLDASKVPGALGDAAMEEGEGEGEERKRGEKRERDEDGDGSSGGQPLAKKMRSDSSKDPSGESEPGVVKEQQPSYVPCAEKESCEDSK